MHAKCVLSYVGHKKFHIQTVDSIEYLCLTTRKVSSIGIRYSKNLKIKIIIIIHNMEIAQSFIHKFSIKMILACICFCSIVGK